LVFLQKPGILARGTGGLGHLPFASAPEDNVTLSWFIVTRGACAVAVVGLAIAPASAAPVIYQLGTVGGADSRAFAVNDAGQVAGWSEITGNTATHAFRYDVTPGSGGVMRELGTLGGMNSQGLAVNTVGQVAGSSYIAGNVNQRAFRYDGTPGSGGVMRTLGTLGGLSSVGRDVNDAGQVAGSSQITSSNVWHAFRYDGTPGSGGVMRDLGSGLVSSFALAVNDLGQVAGYTGNTPPNQAFRYDGTPGSGGVMRMLGTLGGTVSQGWGINNAGQVVGYSYLAGNAATHAFRYDGTPGSGGVMRDLGLFGGTESYAYDVNDAGQVVGWSSATLTPYQRAYLYTGTPGLDGQMIDLENWLNASSSAEGAKWTLYEAWGISNSGWITGYGDYDPDGPGGVAGAHRAYLLDASALLPEPGALSVLTLAAMSLAHRRRKTDKRIKGDIPEYLRWP
jgi:probable HAF family extracellular repeat protein